MSFQRPSVDSTAAMFFTKYSDQSQLNRNERKRFQSTFQASKLGDQNKMNEVQEMFNNYNLFKYGQYATGNTSKRRHSDKGLSVQPNPTRHKNMKERTKQNQSMKQRLEKMKSQRQQLFDKLSVITTKNPRKV